MKKAVRKLRDLGMDLSGLGAELCDDAETYFCTPKGAEIFARAGVDGIHFCFVRGFGETVFAVSPMNTAPDYVHPLATSFADFLRLLLACGDSAALEQAWMWNEAQFDAFLRENPPSAEAGATMERLETALDLRPMEHPWAYLHEIQSVFDPGRLRFPEEFYDPDLNPDAPMPDWEVRFGDTLWCRGSRRQRPGREVRLDTEFFWADHRWRVPAVYVCGKGLMLDLCMRFDPRDLEEFSKKWHLSPDDPEPDFSSLERMQLELEHPAQLELHPTLVLNGRRHSGAGGSTGTYVPGWENGPELSQAVEHYGLDPASGWTISRWEFSTGRRPEVRSLRLGLETLPSQIPGPVFRAEPGLQLTLRLPGDETPCTLTVEEMQQEQADLPLDGNLEYPCFYSTLAYTLTPEPPEDALRVRDVADSDYARTLPNPEAEYSPESAIGIIGGADGPTAVCIGVPDAQPQCRIACSALHFEPAPAVDWAVVFTQTRYSPVDIWLADE